MLVGMDERERREGKGDRTFSGSEPKGANGWQLLVTVGAMWATKPVSASMLGKGSPRGVTNT